MRTLFQCVSVKNCSGRNTPNPCNVADKPIEEVDFLYLRKLSALKMVKHNSDIICGVFQEPYGL